jgi:hypothetical protein
MSARRSLLTGFVCYGSFCLIIMLANMDLQSKKPMLLKAVKPNSNVLFKRLGDETVLFHLDTDRFYELNGTAARFWELLHDGCNVTEIRERMLQEFEVDPDQFAGEAETLLASLMQEDLVSFNE